MSYKNFTVETDEDGFALITWDMPEKSMNVIDLSVMDELDAIVDQVASDDAIKGSVITSGKSAFSGGADLTMLEGLLKDFHIKRGNDAEAAAKALFEGSRKLSQVYRKLETCGKPFVAPSSGTCMGGGTELALACHGRVVDEGLKMGLPEVKVGLFPGAGGTQRVMRMTDGQQGMQFLLQGRTLRAPQAKQMKLVDEVAPTKKLVAAAKKMLKAGLDRSRTGTRRVTSCQTARSIPLPVSSSGRPPTRSTAARPMTTIRVPATCCAPSSKVCSCRWISRFRWKAATSPRCCRPRKPPT